MSSIAVFPGTFDPLTNGHLDIIKRAAKLFDKVIIAVAKSPSKKTLVSLDDRVVLAQKSVESISNVSVVGFSGLLVDFISANHVNVLVRGIRSATDYDYEAQLFGMYRMYLPNLEVVMLQTSSDVAFISSTLVREIYIHKGDISKLVPAPIYEHLRKAQS